MTMPEKLRAELVARIARSLHMVNVCIECDNLAEAVNYARTAAAIQRDLDGLHEIYVKLPGEAEKP